MKNNSFVKYGVLFSLSAAFISFAACSSKPMSNVAPSNLADATQLKRGPATHSWANYHWARSTAQFTLKVGDNLTATDWQGYLQQSSSDWNSPTTFGAAATPLIVAVVTGQANRRCSMVAGTTQVCNGKYGNNGWLGLASINIQGENITQGTAKMNDTYFSTTTYNNPNEKRHVVCQEVAHTFGLDHQSTNGSSLNTCMDYFSNTGANATSTLSTRPNAHDFDELTMIYAHADTTTTVAPMLANLASYAADDEVTNKPETWGDFMGERSRGPSAYYEHHHRDGSLTITHVLWTEERAARCQDCDHRFDH